MVEALRSRHYSRRTEETGLQWIRRFVAFHGGTPLREPLTFCENPSLARPADLSELAGRPKTGGGTGGGILDTQEVVANTTVAGRVGFRGFVLGRPESVLCRSKQELCALMAGDRS